MEIKTRMKHNTQRYYILIQNRKGIWEDFIGDIFKKGDVITHLDFFSSRERFFNKKFKIVKAIYINNRRKAIKETLAEGYINEVIQQLKGATQWLINKNS